MQTTPIGPSPIDDILAVELYTGPPVGEQFTATSLPGHLLHFVITGCVEQTCDGRPSGLRPNSVMWYHQDELVQGKATKGPWRFYSVNFIAEALPPPDFALRHVPDFAAAKPLFERLHRVWNERGSEPVRLLSTHAALLEILAALIARKRVDLNIDQPSSLWWRIESELRKDLSQRMDSRILRRLGAASTATIARSCHQAVGMPPMKRIKQVRMSLARGLIRRGNLSVSAVAERIGYARVHEFSRDYRKHFGVAPSRDRA
jgi:AraC-like DNA-binding protein